MTLSRVEAFGIQFCLIVLGFILFLIWFEFLVISLIIIFLLRDRKKQWEESLEHGLGKAGQRRSIYFDSDEGEIGGWFFSFEFVRAILAFFFFLPSLVHFTLTASYPSFVLLFSLSAFPSSLHPILVSFVFGFFVTGFCDLPPTWDAIGLLYPSALSMAVTGFAFFAEEAAWWDECWFVDQRWRW